MSDTFFADVSEFQNVVDASYPYPVLSIRSNDGTYLDHNFGANYTFMRQQLDAGKLAVGIVYCYWRPNWQATVDTMKAQINAYGGLHPKVVLMIDVESGGNPGGDQSDGINRTYWALADWTGDPRRIIGYANRGDFDSMWRSRPDGLRVIGAGYGQNPNLSGQIAHQYTDGQVGSSQGLPMGCRPFGPCDMNVADGLDPQQLADALGVGSTPKGVPVPDTPAFDRNAPLTVGFFLDFMQGFIGPLISDTKDVREQLTGGRDAGEYPGFSQGGARTLYDLAAAIANRNGVSGTTDTKGSK